MARPKHGYRTEDHERVVGTTTITSRFKDSGGLVGGANKLARDVLEEAVTLIHTGVENQTLWPDRAKAWLDTDPLSRANINVQWYQKAADAGTLAHELVEKHLHGEPAEKPAVMDEVAEAAWKGFDGYLAWERGAKLEVLATEMPLVSEAHRFGGTPDAVGMVDGTLSIVDWKTSRRVYPEMLLQLSAYLILWEENNPSDRIERFDLCQFSKETGGFSHHYWPRTALDPCREMFLCLLKAYEWDRFVRKMV